MKNCLPLFVLLALALAFPASAQTAGGACSNAGRFHESGTESLICDSSVWKPVITFSNSGKIAFQADYDSGSCTTVKTGRIRYDGANVWEYCNGTTWMGFGPAGSTPCNVIGQSPGYVCPDGSLFLGFATSTTTYVPIYTTRCDAGQTWNGSACTGTASALEWGSDGIDRNTTSNENGEADTATLAAFGAAAHPAAHFCQNLVVNGRSDWYLPSPAEATRFYASKAAIGNLDGTYYWGTFEADSNTATTVALWGDGHIDYQSKASTQNVRCVRRD